MPFKLFIDSDVVITFFTDREPFANAASELFELNEKNNIVIYMSAVSINNIYYILRRFLGHHKTHEVIESLTEMTEIIGTNEQDIIQALKNDFKDLEDSIQYASALTIEGLDAIITRNTKEYRKSKIAVMTPLNFLKLKEKNES